MAKKKVKYSKHIPAQEVPEKRKTPSLDSHASHRS